MNHLVSVIVPIYKVEKYLRKCLDSISKQSYANLQVILVNDGSPDNCQMICESFCKEDSRFVLISKENGGLSSARNAGLDVAKGDFVVCVDSDDWVESNMIEILLADMLKYDADMSVCSFFKNRSEQILEEFFDNRVECISQEEAVFRLITPGKFYGFAWNKMYKRSLIGLQRYDVSLLKGEDSPFTFDYVLKCGKIVVHDIPLYHYRIDSVSISRSQFNVGKMTVLNSYQYIVDRLNEKGFPKKIVDMQKVQYANQLLSLRTNIVLSRKNVFEACLKRIDDEMSTYIHLYLKSDLIDFKHKFAFVLAVRVKFIFKLMCLFYRGGGDS